MGVWLSSLFSAPDFTFNRWVGGWVGDSTNRRKVRFRIVFVMAPQELLQ